MLKATIQSGTLQRIIYFSVFGSLICLGAFRTCLLRNEKPRENVNRDVVLLVRGRISSNAG